MNEFSEWRGFDLSERILKIKRAFNRTPVTSADDIPILINAPCYFSFGSKDKPRDYYTNPASMFNYQADGYEKHLKLVHDDYVPYFMPWFGTGVLASAFGARVHMPDNPADDPAVVEPCITTLEDAAHLVLPDPTRDGWMPRVLDTIDWAVENGDLPVGLTDMQGPLGTLGLMLGQVRLYEWMYKEPKLIHELFQLVTNAFIMWVKIQKEHIGEPLFRSNGLQGAYSPGCGVWESDDDLVLIDPGLYREFVVPYVSQIFNAFGGGSIHFCGNGVQHIENILQIDNVRVVNNSPLGDFEGFTTLRKGLGNRYTIQIQDAVPIDTDSYYANLFADIEDFSGLMMASFVMDNTGMDGKGGYLPIEWDPYETANRVVDSVRQNVAKKLAGKQTVKRNDAKATKPVSRPPADKAIVSEEHPADHESALKLVRERLIAFDGDGLKDAIQVGLDTGVEPTDIILKGMSDAMGEVGALYEAGEFFVPQLVMAGNTMKEGMDILKPLLQLQQESGVIQSKGRVIIGTVKGDLHDIGKNLVSMMLEGAGFDVIDLGVDVSPETFVAEAQAHKANLLALSALLTTTMAHMKATIEALDAAGLHNEVKVMIGGAPLTKEFADQIGASGYAASAVSAVTEAERLTKITE